MKRYDVDGYYHPPIPQHDDGRFVFYSEHVAEVEELRRAIEVFAERINVLREERDEARELVKAFVAKEIYFSQKRCQEAVKKWESEK